MQRAIIITLSILLVIASAVIGVEGMIIQSKNSKLVELSDH